MGLPGTPSVTAVCSRLPAWSADLPNYEILPSKDGYILSDEAGNGVMVGKGEGAWPHSCPVGRATHASPF